MASPAFYEEIYDYYTRPFWQTTWFYVLIASCVFALIVVGIYLWLRGKKKPLTAWDWALGELKKTTPAHCTHKEDFKKFYFQLTAITKMYLHRRFGWQVQDKTDTELVLFLEQQAFDRTIIEMIEKVSEGALWVKFANMDVLKSQAEADWKSIVAMVERTTQVTWTF